MSYSGSVVKEARRGKIEDGIEFLKSNPSDYMAMHFQTSMQNWPEDQQAYTLYKRTPKTELMPQLHGGPFTWISCKSETLKPAVEVRLEEDGYTNQNQLLGNFQGYYLSEAKRPGRGEGCADLSLLDLMDDVDPNDVGQGRVGDCWLLSAISALAEFDGAVHQLFNRTEGWSDRSLPFSDKSNMYEVTLYDLPTGQPKQVTVDERLCYTAQGDGLLGAIPSLRGELWVCYLEKAIAAHCGGWDAIDGGVCTHAWALLTGSREQFQIMRQDGGSFKCYGNPVNNPNDGTPERMSNNPKENRGVWGMDWPEEAGSKYGGGGGRGSKSEDELFLKMVDWDDNNYIMGAGTRAGSDANTTDGIVDGHAYTVLSCVRNAGGNYGDDFDLIRVRNPWGKTEFQSGLWSDNGRGWSYYPAVKNALNPLQREDGIFWLTKREFFRYFGTVYLCAKDMTEFKHDENAVST